MSDSETISEEVQEISTSHIQTISSTPPYISTFINNNLEQLNKIYEKEYNHLDVVY